MNKSQPTFILYYYVHLKIVERFGTECLIFKDDVANFLANRFRIPRQIKKKILFDMDKLGLLEIVGKSVLRINPSTKKFLMYL